VETWDDFITAAKTFATDDQKATFFPTHDLLLRQRGSDYFDADGNVTLDSDDSIELMEWILALRDEHGIAEQAPADDALWAGYREGRSTSWPGADWYAGFFKDNAPELTGLWKARPLPVWEPGGSRTSCHGGTGACIISTSPNVEEAWKFLQYSMLSVEGNVRRYEMTNLFPPYIPAMDNERLHFADEYFSGMDLGGLFAEIAPEVPPQYQSPYRAELNLLLTPLWQEVYDGFSSPRDTFTEVADEIRTVMEEEME
jgi:ABC-type glycerol-3-phosphate transport system substrate-binding protein